MATSEQRKPKDAGGRRRGQAFRLLAAALRLLRSHVRCTCGMKYGKHSQNCHIMRALRLSRSAEALGVRPHFGFKRGRRRIEMERTVVAWVALCLALTAPAAAQTPDTLTFDVEGHGLVSGIQHECPITQNGKLDAYVGTEVVCRIWVVDNQGNPTLGTIDIEIADSTRANVYVEGDSLHILIIQRGNTRVKMFPRPILLLAAVYPDNLAFYGPGDLAWDTVPPLFATVTKDEATGQSIAHIRTTFCAYLGDSFGGAVAKGRAPAQTTPCPDIGGTPLPEFPVEWAVASFTDANGLVPLPRPVIAMPIQPLGLFPKER